MRSYEERAKDFIKEIYPLIENDNWWIDYAISVDVFNKNNNRKVLCFHGAARVALITSDYVVKIEYDENEVEDIGGCENEVELYEYAKREGFAYLFAAITPFQYKDRIFYIMPRIRNVGKYEEYADAYMTDDEIAFCDKYGVTDLHRNNYGMRNGHVCIVDYACRLLEEPEYSSSIS